MHERQDCFDIQASHYMCSTLDSLLNKFSCMRNLSNGLQTHLENRLPNNQREGGGRIESDESVPSQVFFYHSKKSEDRSVRVQKIEDIGTASMGSKELNNHTGLTVDTTKMSSHLNSSIDCAEECSSFSYQSYIRVNEYDASSKCIHLNRSMSSISCPSFDEAYLYSFDNSQDLIEREDDEAINSPHIFQKSDVVEMMKSNDSLLSFDGFSSVSKGSDALHDLLSFDSTEDQRDDISQSMKDGNSRLRVRDICEDSV
eukprot:CAMPEP_0194103864 /NCGR_PEP_ID=MMETSP0150-20130528/4227_1 /TAXON_ID=122233 /ORGANISM="Chaetoceros debilis, Strain MM31A-1" /LENGTH=256 /DNA_ID=CAMNT_0038791199 /DNA_START=256 /DNA_END=1022 /DNA_ORIENTATION=-